MDGYTVSRMDQMQELCNKQLQINEQLEEVSQELHLMPIMPKNIDRWINSVSIGDNRFKLADFSRMFAISRRYDRLIDERGKNSSQLKIGIIDNIIEQINLITEGKKQ